MRSAIYLIILCLLISCKKNNDAPLQEQEVKGILYHNVTRQFLPGHKVDLYVTEFWVDKTQKDPAEYPDGLPTYFTAYYSAITDAVGKFSFKFKPQHDWTYDLHIITPDLIFAGSNRWGTLKISRPPYIAHNISDTLYAEKPAFIRYNIQNAAPVFANDSLHIFWTVGTYTKTGQKIGLYSWLNLFKSYYPFYPPLSLKYTGSNVNEQVTDTVPAESKSKFPVKWIHSRNGIILNVEDSIPVIPFSISSYNISY